MGSFSLSNTLTHRCMFCPVQGPRSKALEEVNANMEKNQLWLRKTSRKAFYAAVACDNFREGAEKLLQVSTVSLYETFYFMKMNNKPTNLEKSIKLMCNRQVSIDIFKCCRNRFY